MLDERGTQMSNQFMEIERKFLLESFPANLPLKKQLNTYQAYLSVEPEVRIRRTETDEKDVAYFLTIKSNGTLVRKEVEMIVCAENFYALAEMVPYSFIKKEYRVYELPNGLQLECSLVDGGSSCEFMYAEVEFPSVEEAERFAPCFDYVGEITQCADYKMKNYWKRTRLKGKI